MMTRFLAVLFLVSLIKICFAAEQSNHFSQKVEKSVRYVIKTRQGTQKAEDEWAIEKQTLKTKYEILQQKNEQLYQQKNRLTGQIAAVEERILQKEKQL